MVYAPIAIITLNRYEHLKRLLESLEKNKEVGDTELFVSVDYPISETQQIGYEKICGYLDKKKAHNSFKQLNIYMQQRNLGPAENCRFIERIIYEKYDRYIFLEDDNEVSPNFIEYMNIAMEWAATHEKAYSVCGYSRLASNGILYPLVKDNNMYLLPQFSAWGVGMFKEKYETMRKTITKDWTYDIARDNKKLWRLYKYSKYTFWQFAIGYLVLKRPVFFEGGNIRPIDIFQEIYVVINDMYVVFPSISKIRNRGYDGSGQNCGCEDWDYEKMDLDDKISFEVMENDPLKLGDKQMSYIASNIPGAPSNFQIFKAVVAIFIWRVMNSLKIKKYFE